MITISDWVAGIGYCLCLLLACAGFIIVIRPARVRAPRALLLPLAIYAAVLIVSTATSPLSISLRMISFCGAVGAFVVAKRIGHRWPVSLLRIVGTAIGIIAIQDGLAVAGRATVLGNPNMVAGILVLCWPWGRGWMWEVSASGGLLATGSRGGILASLIGLIAARRQALPASRQWRKSAAVLVGVLLAAVIVALIAWRPATIARRWAVWGEAINLFVQRPLLGWGAGGYGNLARIEPFKAHADNALLTVLVETGLLGAAAWGWLMWSVARQAWRSQSPARWALLAWGLQQLVDDTLAWPWVAVLWGLNLAML